jgi:hypothetical protein
MREANLYETLADNKVRCNLCAHHCVIASGRKGICQVRENRGGTLNTPIVMLRKAQEIGLEEGLKYIYPDNLLDNGDQDTPCPGCGCVLIQRRGFIVLHNRVINGYCPDCGEPIAGVGMTGEREENEGNPKLPA